MTPASASAKIAAAYPEWFAAHGAPDRAALASMAAECAGMGPAPLVSVIFPDARSDAALASVLAQSFGAFDCVLAAACGGPVDAPLTLLNLPAATGLAARCTAGLAVAAGEFVMILGPGDRLAPHALLYFTDALRHHPQTDAFTCDDDEVTPQGGHHAPRFKAGWDPDLLLTQDYIGGAIMIRRSLLQQAGGFDAADGNAAVYGAVLRALAAAGPGRVRHIPAVLLHRAQADPFAAAAGWAGAAQRFLGESASVVASPLAPGCNRIVWPLPSPAPLVSVIVPVRDRAHLLLDCAEGVLHHTDYAPLELLIVDNGSELAETFAAFDQLAQDPRVRILHAPGPFNYAALNNAAVARAEGSVVVLLNSDTRVLHKEWLTEMVSQALRPDVGPVGAKLLYGDGRLQHGGVLLVPGGGVVHCERLAAADDPGYLGQLNVQRGCPAVTGACMAMRRSVFLEAGGFDEQTFAVAFNDVDLCLRLRDYGYRAVWTPFAVLEHLESASRGLARTAAERARDDREVYHLRRRWHALFTAGLHLNLNLSSTWDETLHLAAPAQRLGRAA